MKYLNRISIYELPNVQDSSLVPVHADYYVVEMNALHFIVDIVEYSWN